MREMELNEHNIRLLFREVDLSLGDFVNVVGLDAYTSLVVKTPVGNPDLWKSKPPKGYVGGLARFSWKMKHGQPDVSLPLQWSTSMPQTPRLTNHKYDKLFITSAAPHMPALEDGHSTQGAHMLKRTVSYLQQKYN